MATKKKIFEWKKFTWLSDSSIIWVEWQYSNESYNIDTQTEPNWVKLTPKPELLLTTTDTPRFILNAADYWKSWIFVFCDDWEIYKDGVSIHTAPDRIKWAIWQYIWPDDHPDDRVFYILFFTKNTVYKIKYSDNSVSTIDTFQNHSDYKYPINVYWEIYFASWNVLYKISNEWVLESVLYRFPKQESVMWITFFQDNFNIYTTTWNYWRQYLFPILSETPYYNIEWKWLPILWALNSWWLDYVVAWYNELYSDLYVVSWTQRKALKINWEWNNARWFHWELFSRLDDVYISWRYSWQEKLFRFWNYYNWFNQELIPYLNFSNEVTCINSSAAALYVWTQDNEVYIVDLNSIPPDYQTDWEIVSIILDFWSPDTKKYLNEIHLAYDNESTKMSNRWWEFVLYARKYETDSWVELYSTWNLSDTWNIEIHQTALAEKWFNDFYQLQFKVKLISNSNNTTPFFKKLKVIYTDDIN